jgi:hypothetical protein
MYRSLGNNQDINSEDKSNDVPVLENNLGQSAVISLARKNDENLQKPCICNNFMSHECTYK